MGFRRKRESEAEGRARAMADALVAVIPMGDPSIIREALAAGVDVNAPNRTGVPPLLLALGLSQVEIAGLLLDAGADVNARDPQMGRNALHWVASRGLDQLVLKIVTRGADPRSTCDDPPMTALGLAARAGHVETARALLDAGADPDESSNIAEGRTGTTPLVLSASEGHVETIRLLVERGAQPNTPQADGLTPLMAAADAGHLEAVRALVEARANINLIHLLDPNQPFTALDLARLRGHREVVAFLEARDAIAMVQGKK